MESIVLVVHVLLAIGVIGVVLIQHGKGADAGAAFGSGASGTVFGAAGAGGFLVRLTTALVAAFFATSIVLFYMAAHRDGGGSVLDAVPAAVEEAAPAPVGDVPTVVPAGGESASDGGDLPPPT
ncbi:MAG: preprotein translocase subunit SecG, partial [Granulosicoccaceae bacterium]